MIGFLSKIFGGSKSDKDVRRIQPLIAEINRNFTEYQALSHDELRNKTRVFRQRIQDHLTEIDAQIAARQSDAEAVTDGDLQGREAVYQEIDKLIERRDEKIAGFIG